MCAKARSRAVTTAYSILHFVCIRSCAELCFDCSSSACPARNQAKRNTRSSHKLQILIGVEISLTPSRYTSTPVLSFVQQRDSSEDVLLPVQGSQVRLVSPRLLHRLLLFIIVRTAAMLSTVSSGYRVSDPHADVHHCLLPPWSNPAQSCDALPRRRSPARCAPPAFASSPFQISRLASPPAQPNSTAASLLYPTYASYKALRPAASVGRTPADQAAHLERWLMFWCVMGGVALWEQWAEWGVSW